MLRPVALTLIFGKVAEVSKRFVTAFIVVALIGFGVSTADAKSGRTALRMIPSGTAMVMAVNVDTLKGSPVFQKIAGKMTTQNSLRPALELLRRGAGVDIRKDVSTIVVGLAADFERSKKAALFIEAKVDRKKLLAFAKRTDPKFKKLVHGGVSYYRLGAEIELAFLGSYIALAGKHHMARLLDVRAGRSKSISQDAAFRSMVNAGTTQRDIWGVFQLPAQVRALLAPQVGNGGVSMVMVGAEFAQGMDLHLRIAAKTVPGAAALAKQLRTWLATAGSNTQLSALGLGKALRAFQVNVINRKVDVTGALSPKQLAPIKSLILNLL